MFTFKSGDIAIPKEDFLPIDAEGKWRKKSIKITKEDPLTVVTVSRVQGEERLTFIGVEGQYLACFFDLAPQLASSVPQKESSSPTVPPTGEKGVFEFDEVHGGEYGGIVRI